MNGSPSKLGELPDESYCEPLSMKEAEGERERESALESHVRTNRSGKFKPSNTSCKKSRGQSSVSKNTEYKASARKCEAEMSSPRNYIERYLRSLKCQTKGAVAIHEFNEIQIGQEARGRVVESTSRLT